MGIVTSAGRMIELTAQQNDYEFAIDSINQARRNLLTSLDAININATDLDPQSPEARLMEQRKQRLMLIDKKLDNDLQKYQIKLKMVAGEMPVAEQQFNSGIQRSYK